ncbi:uncharacterized protein LOC129918767 [Episyrphus balteatus]|uniref:uncharacterized protein LOC129918767 n=1 Tax=Episyrphus balteatus TaxID=286459 RepID=UPI00248549FE|nr:uncharacterized protein LOC129918767 [Episyrphus balteatus]
MSLPREWNLQDSRGSLYCPSEPDPTSGVQYQSGGFVRTPTSIPEVASSQPAAPSILTECQQSGSLFSIHSAPPVPNTEFTTQPDSSFQSFACNGISTLSNIGLNAGGANGEEFRSNNNSHQALHGSQATCNSAAATLETTPRRPATLAIEATCYPARTLHSSLLEHQISEIEEDDNENLLTVSSITARPLIAKSHELRSNRLAGKRHKYNGSSNKTTNGGGGNNKVVRIATTHHKDTKDGGTSSRSSISADPPDGGYGWFIVFGAFSVQFWVAGLVKSYGVLYVEIMETFPSTTATVASWIPAILSALCLALAPLSSALCQKFSCRSVVFAGGVFCALGMTLSYFATSLVHLLFTFGILTGIGGGLSTTPGIVIVSQYFDKHRALANGICVSGTAAGSFILPVLIKHLADKFGFHGTILILGGCMLHVCVSATLYKPLEESSHLDSKNIECSQPLTDINPSNTGLLTNSTYLDSCDETASNKKFIEHLFLEESKNRRNDYYNTDKCVNNNDKSHNDSDDEYKDTIGETTFMKPMKSVRSSGILHSVEDLSTDSTWVYRKHSGSDSNRGSRRRRNVFANDEIISKIQAHLEKPISPPPTSANRGLSKSMEIPTPVSNLAELKNQKIEVEDDYEDDDPPRTCCDRIQTYLDISLLRDPTFILMCLSVTLMSVGCPYMLYYLPAHVISIGYSKSEAGYLVAMSAALDLIGRLGLGWLSDLQLFDRKKTYIVCILGAGIAVLTIPSVHSFYLLGSSAAVYGLCLGCWYVLMPVLLADIFGTDRISSSYGLVRMFQSIGAISVPPLAGFLRDLSGSYDICFYCMGACMIMGCVPLLVWAVLDCQQSKRLISIKNDDSEDNFTVS